MQVTVATVARAVRKNGWKQAFGTFDNGKGAKCALGQAASNLSVSPNALQDALYGIQSPISRESLSSYIINLNDEGRFTLDQIADRIESDWAEYLDELVTV